ncbi:hypothetical protein L4X63_13560 [Geomonas sp. Red32]|uniref:hypothetical protein n=1 Tax=Geomonas sp. Red32 TaxID=2912856 RepID=UPI00202CD257|nr:hypothetical protein [Geomonas sp. Red32]MCM0082622.1 hypothetical protein [Geomonas sp. Red32]
MSLLFLLMGSHTAWGAWELYREDESVVASVNILSYEPYHGQPSVWVRWHYVKPKGGEGGVKIQFTASCSQHRLFAIATYPYDRAGDYLKPQKNQPPIEYPLKPDSLNDATYRLLCR